MTDIGFDATLRTLDRLQFIAAQTGDDEEWERLAEARLEVNCARAGDGA